MLKPAPLHPGSLVHQSVGELTNEEPNSARSRKGGAQGLSSLAPPQ